MRALGRVGSAELVGSGGAHPGLKVVLEEYGSQSSALTQSPWNISVTHKGVPVTPAVEGCEGS